jgi:large subunit ribosomal protein L6
MDQGPEIVGIGYRAEMKGKGMVVFRWATRTRSVSAAFRHRRSCRSKQTKLTVSGIDRQKVGQVSAEMRALRPPDPYRTRACVTLANG